MVKKSASELKTSFETGEIPTGQDFTDLIDSSFNEEFDTSKLLPKSHALEAAPHQYGGKFEWRYNPTTNSLDLVVLT